MSRSLHSNMFLLIPKDDVDWYRVEINFTFQYVSINTTMITPPMDDLFSLHSNMFLLIQALDTSSY